MRYEQEGKIHFPLVIVNPNFFDMRGIEELREHLFVVSAIAPTGAHKEVAERAGIDVSYLWMIRRGKRLKKDKVSNQIMISELINHYREINRGVAELMQKI